MDKYEYKVRSEEIERLIDAEKYAEAVSIADTIDWRRVKSITMLLRIAALYRVNRRNEDSRALLLLAYDRYPTNRSVVYSLCEVSIELDDVVAAIEYYKQFVKLAPRDNGVFTLRYRILEAQEASLEERIELLEELKKRDYQEEWAYELAYLYHRVGLATKCVEECDDMILWFGEGPYVRKAMELKMLHAPLTEVQQAKYDNLEGDTDNSYSDGEYAENTYYNDTYYNYNNEAEADEEYFDVSYSQTSGVEAGYSDADYGQTGYAEDSYTGEFYVEQTYDENGYPVEDYGSSYGEENYPNTGYGDSYSYSYPNEGYGYTQTVTPVDMSQYNTINLQKVVAESMKELFPDEEENVFAQESVEEEIPQEEVLSDPETQIYAMNGQYEAPDVPAQENASTIAIQAAAPQSTTGRVAEMVTNVSEKNPEPDTGAIKKVFLPGKDARFMKDDIEPEEPVEAPEQTADTAQNPETNESILKEAPRLQSGEEEPFKPIAGQMKLDDVLAEWERMKQENAQKHQEEIKQQVLTQTGKILAQFDNSLKSGILGELAQEEEKAERAAAGGNSPEKDEIFEVDLEQDELTDDEDRYDVEYESEADEESDVTQSEDDEEYIVESEEDEEYYAAAPDEEESVAADGASDGERDTAEEIDAADDDEHGSAESEERDADMAESKAPEAGADHAAEPGDSEGHNAALANDYTEPMSEIEQMVQDELGGRTVVLPTEKITAALKKAEEAAGGFDDDEPYAEESYEEEASAGLDPEDEEMIAEMAKEDALKTQEIKMNTADLSTLSDKIVATTSKEAKGAKREEVRDFSPEEQKLFENFAVTKKIKKQIIFALEKMTLAAYTGNIIITGEAGLDTVRLAKNLLREFQETDANFSGKMAKIDGEKLNTKNLKETFYKLGNGAIIIEKANGMSEEKLYEMTTLLNQETLGIIVILTDTKKEISLLLEKQAMTADYFNIRIDLIEMDNNALVSYAKNYALALEYSIDELGTLALYTRISNIQTGNHVVTKDEVRDIIDEAIWRSKKSRIKNFVDVLFSKRYDSEDMIVLKERDFM